MLRLAIGLPLVGAGFQGYLFAPTLAFDTGSSPVLRVLFIGIGFFILFGLATRIAATVGLIMYAWVLLAADPAVVIAMEYVPGVSRARDPRQRSAERRRHAAGGREYAGVVLRSDRSRPPPEVVFRRANGPTTPVCPDDSPSRNGNHVRVPRAHREARGPRPGVARRREVRSHVGRPRRPGAVGRRRRCDRNSGGAGADRRVLHPRRGLSRSCCSRRRCSGSRTTPSLAHVALFGMASAVFTLGSGPLSFDRLVGRPALDDDEAVIAAD